MPRSSQLGGVAGALAHHLHGCAARRQQTRGLFGSGAGAQQRCACAAQVDGAGDRHVHEAHAAFVRQRLGVAHSLRIGGGHVQVQGAGLQVREGGARQVECCRAEDRAHDEPGLRQPGAGRRMDGCAKLRGQRAQSIRRRVVAERHDVVALGLEGLCVALSHHAAAKQDGFHGKEQKSTNRIGFFPEFAVNRAGLGFVCIFVVLFLVEE